MEWYDEGIILHKTYHGESCLIVSILTKERGRVRSLLQGKRNLPFDVGFQVHCKWRARLEAHLGRWVLDSIPCATLWKVAEYFPLRLMGLMCLLKLCEVCLAERTPVVCVYKALLEFYACLADDSWIQAFVKVEAMLLQELGVWQDLENPGTSLCALGIVLTEHERGLRTALGASFPSVRHVFGNSLGAVFCAVKK